VSLNYRLPYPSNQTSLPIISRYAVEHLGIFAPPSVQISGGGFAAAGQAQGFNAYTRDSVAANTPLLVSVSGTAPPPAPDAAGGNDAQNPSVNSRIETGGEAPVASVTTLPARLDSLKWILVGGFIALFLLGSIFVLRQPQASVSEVGTAKNNPATTQRSGRRSASSASANVDREVRGSLDDLKDILFRLELRREAGTINDADYNRERDRVQKDLRDLVKG